MLLKLSINFVFRFYRGLYRVYIFKAIGKIAFIRNVMRDMSFLTTSKHVIESFMNNNLNVVVVRTVVETVMCTFISA